MNCCSLQPSPFTAYTPSQKAIRWIKDNPLIFVLNLLVLTGVIFLSVRNFTTQIKWMGGIGGAVALGFINGYHCFDTEDRLNPQFKDLLKELEINNYRIIDSSKVYLPNVQRHLKFLPETQELQLILYGHTKMGFHIASLAQADDPSFEQLKRFTSVHT